MSKTKISWCDEVWNPVVGCTAACSYCYARELHDRRHQAWLAGRWPLAPMQYHFPFSQIQLFPERLDIPLRRKHPTVFFVDSFGDLFDKNVPNDFLCQVYQTMANCPEHTFLVLTKQEQRMVVKTASNIMTLENVWHGVTVEDQKRADARIPYLLHVPGKHFLSIEPMLGPIDLSAYLLGIDAVILGGETGKDARPLQRDWVRAVRDQCAAAGVPFFFKAWGEYAPNWSNDDDGQEIPGSLWMDRMGKRLAGRTLDGVLHNALPWDGGGA